MTPEIKLMIAEGALAGIAAGLFPVLTAIRHRRLTLGIQGLLGTVLLGVYAGWLLAIPGAVYSSWRIIHDSIVAAESLDFPMPTDMLRN